MKSTVKNILAKIRAAATTREELVSSRAMGRDRVFEACDLGDDTFVFEKGVWSGLDEHASVLLVEKRDLRRGTRGHVMTVTTGNHAVAALPLLGGKFWDLARVAPLKRGETLTKCVLCSNVVGGKLEISQREVMLRKLVALDAWLLSDLEFGPADVVIADRNPLTLDHYRRNGREWRVKPLAWTENEMRVAIAASRKRMSSDLVYYHNARGVHLLVPSEFHRFVKMAREDYSAFKTALGELTDVFEGNETDFLRQPKYHGHHEVELFGLRRGVALERIVPMLESLGADVRAGSADERAVASRIFEIEQLYLSLLSSAELADENSRKFAETLYIYLTGEIYSVIGGGETQSFDDRRTALPGAVFNSSGRPQFDDGADARTKVLLSNIRPLLSRGEQVLYANVYELRASGDGMTIGEAPTREVVYKTNRSPSSLSFVEKRLLRSTDDYASYVLARVKAFKAFGVALADYRLLHRRVGETRQREAYYIRTRCEGEPMDAIPGAYFRQAGEWGGDDGESPAVVEALVALLGDAAAQNLAIKKYDPVTKTPLFDVGKEIYRFEYNLKAQSMMPLTVSCCSVRGSLGWPDLSFTDENLEAIASFYMDFYVNSFLKFSKAHPCVPVERLAEDFFEGFEFRLRAMEWKFTIARDDFEDFDPHLPPRYRFREKWRFVLWTLERHVRRIARLRRVFDGKLREQQLQPRSQAPASNGDLVLNLK